MASGWKVEAEGRLGGEVVTVEVGGKLLRECSLAVQERVKRDGEWSDGKLWWWDLKDWDGVLEGGKGDIVRVRGRAQTRRWISKDGNEMERITITLDREGGFEMVKPKQGGSW